MGTKGRGKKKAPEITAHSSGRRKEIQKVAKWLARSQDMGDRGKKISTTWWSPRESPSSFPPPPPGGPLVKHLLHLPSLSQAASMPLSWQAEAQREGWWAQLLSLHFSSRGRFHQFSWGLCRHRHSHQAVCQQCPSLKNSSLWQHLPEPSPLCSASPLDESSTNPSDSAEFKLKREQGKPHLPSVTSQVAFPGLSLLSS